MQGGRSDECVVADTVFKCVRLEFIQLLFERGWVGIRITKLLLVFLSLKKKRCEFQPYFREAFETIMDTV